MPKRFTNKIVRAEDAPAPLRLDLLLQMRVERHDKKRPGHAHQKERPRKSALLGFDSPASRAPQISPHEPIGNQPDFHLMRGHARDQETAADDAHAQRGRVDAGMRRRADLVQVDRTGRTSNSVR